MKTFKSLLSIAVVGMALVGCDSKSNNNNNDNPNPNPAPAPVQQDDVNSGNSNGYNGSIDEAATYRVRVACNDNGAQAQLPFISIKFSLKRDGTYVQEINSLDKRCRDNCYMHGEGSFSSAVDSLTFKQIRLVSDREVLQGPRTTTYVRKFPVADARRASVIVLIDNGNQNLCNGPMEMTLIKERRNERNDRHDDRRDDRDNRK